MEGMIKDTGLRNYRILVYYFLNKIPVHFKDLDNTFYNGLILCLSEDKLTMVLAERIKGEIPILLEFVQHESISKFKERDE